MWIRSVSSIALWWLLMRSDRAIEDCAPVGRPGEDGSARCAASGGAVPCRSPDGSMGAWTSQMKRYAICRAPARMRYDPGTSRVNACRRCCCGRVTVIRARRSGRRRMSVIFRNSTRDCLAGSGTIESTLPGAQGPVG